MTKRLYKGKDKKIFGVCSGLAEYFDLDPTVMRLIFVAAVLLFGTGILLYIIMAIIMPDPPVVP
jgi:phage shock protein PspC (stress-responsive transcriptional regulator)